MISLCILIILVFVIKLVIKLVLFNSYKYKEISFINLNSESISDLVELKVKL